MGHKRQQTRGKTHFFFFFFFFARNAPPPPSSNPRRLLLCHLEVGQKLCRPSVRAHQKACPRHNHIHTHRPRAPPRAQLSPDVRMAGGYSAFTGQGLSSLLVQTSALRSRHWKTHQTLNERSPIAVLLVHEILDYGVLTGDRFRPFSWHSTRSQRVGCSVILQCTSVGEEERRSRLELERCRSSTQLNFHSPPSFDERVHVGRVEVKKKASIFLEAATWED